MSKSTVVILGLTLFMVVSTPTADAPSERASASADPAAASWDFASTIMSFEERVGRACQQTSTRASKSPGCLSRGPCKAVYYSPYPGVFYKGRACGNLLCE